MTEAQYRRISAPFRTSGRAKLLRWVNHGLTVLCYVTYPITLLLLALGRDGRFFPALIVPAAGFGVVSLYRRLWDAPRPYEVLDIDPIIPKTTRGRSFPSRHVFSVFVIAMTDLWLLPPVGVGFLFFGVLLALCRVIGGVHFPRDVVVGAAIGILSGIVGYWWIFG